MISCLPTQQFTAKSMSLIEQLVWIILFKIGNQNIRNLCLSESALNPYYTKINYTSLDKFLL